MDYTAQENGERFFPDGLRDPCALDRQVENGTWKRQMEMLSTLGVSLYGAVDGVTVHDIQSSAIAGNGVGCKGNKFVGYIDTERGFLHIDCLSDPTFWLDIRLSECSFWKHAPGEEGAAASQASFEARAAAQDAPTSSEA
jgi:hypothetical protein